MYLVAGLAAQAERWMRGYKAAQLNRREIQARARQELHLLEVHVSRVKAELLQMEAALRDLGAQEAKCVAQTHDNFGKILSAIDRNEASELYDLGSLEEFTKYLKDLSNTLDQPVRERTNLAQVAQGLPQIPQMGIDEVDPGTVAFFHRAKAACVDPLARIESSLARERQTQNS
jgi:hypothetical protein